MIPVNKIINDNHGQHYRTMEGKLNWLTGQFNRVLSGFESLDGFTMPKEKKMTHSKNISIICEVWRCTNRLFDPQNYAKTFKAPIDLLVKNEWLPDDNWKNIRGITYTGGGSDVWRERAIRLGNDGLPEEITPEWWKQYSDDYGDIFIRILGG